MRYLVRHRIFSIQTSFWITDQGGNEVFYVDAQSLFNKTFQLADRAGNVLAVLKQPFFQLRASMDIERDGQVLATVTRAMFSPFQHRYEIALADGSTWQAQGEFSDMSWDLSAGGRIVGRISREWFAVRDAFGVEVEPGQDAPLVIAIAVAIDHLREEEQHRR
jgi:uncharacterized protein YxjI